MAKHNIWKDPSRYGDYDGPPGHPDQWRRAFGEAADKNAALKTIERAGQTPWEILGIAPSATLEQAKEAYYRLIRKWHPDVKGGDLETCKKIIAAWVVLEETFATK